MDKIKNILTTFSTKKDLTVEIKKLHEKNLYNGVLANYNKMIWLLFASVVVLKKLKCCEIETKSSILDLEKGFKDLVLDYKSFMILSRYDENCLGFIQMNLLKLLQKKNKVIRNLNKYLKDTIVGNFNLEDVDLKRAESILWDLEELLVSKNTEELNSLSVTDVVFKTE